MRQLTALGTERRDAFSQGLRRENASYRESEMMVFWWEGEAQVSKDTTVTEMAVVRIYSR